jgi:hypothetical protein
VERQEFRANVVEDTRGFGIIRDAAFYAGFWAGHSETVLGLVEQETIEL